MVHCLEILISSPACCKSYVDSVDRDELIKFSDMIWMRATRTELAQNRIAACRGPCRSLG